MRVEREEMVEMRSFEPTNTRDTKVKEEKEKIGLE
jgi:hypothetical protein